jgi:hypothetical protein
MFARYLSNVFHIELSKEVRFFETKREDENFAEVYSIFAHEYWHYLLNISTTVRLRDFTFWYQQFPILSSALQFEQNGEVDVSELTSNDKNLASELGELYVSYANCGIKYEGDEVEDYLDYKTSNEIVEVDLDLTLKGEVVPFKEAQVEITVTTNSGEIPGILIINTDYIEESVANSIEMMICDTGKETPILPYHFLLKLSEYFTGAQLSHFEIASIGTLSLLTENPARYLNSLFKDYHEFRQTLDIEKSLEKLAETIKPIYEQICKVILSDLDDILRVYKKRHPSYQAIKFIKEKVVKGMIFRNKSLLFELTPFKNNTLNQAKLDDLILDYFKPCDVIQLKDGHEDKIMRDEIRSFETDEIKVDEQLVAASYLMQVMSCQLDFFKAHWGIYALFNSGIAESKCPFYSVCDLDCRKLTPEICANKPWKSYLKDGEKCAYAFAVGNLIGFSSFKNE